VGAQSRPPYPLLSLYSGGSLRPSSPLHRARAGGRMWPTSPSPASLRRRAPTWQGNGWTTRGGGAREEGSVQATLEGKPVKRHGGAARSHVFVAPPRPNRSRQRVSRGSSAGAVPHFGVWEGSSRSRCRSRSWSPLKEALSLSDGSFIDLHCCSIFLSEQTKLDNTFLSEQILWKKLK
jgi:hypothetical protein